ncbi:hypothetical protein [Burkholderia cepacia]|uniref:hypothetical protein n=1 Tax=Burkholderia cepacia TaxID=292 RepID=UPI00398F3BAC
MPLQQSIKRFQDYRMVVGHGDGYCFHISNCVFSKNMTTPVDTAGLHQTALKEPKRAPRLTLMPAII